MSPSQNKETWEPCVPVLLGLVHVVILGTYSDRFQLRRVVEICEMPIVTPTQALLGGHPVLE